MNHKRKGKIVVLHLAARYPFAGVIWQLLHHLIGLRELGLDVYYIEDHRAYVYDPIAERSRPTPTRNLQCSGGVLERYRLRRALGVSRRRAASEYVGMARERCLRAAPRTPTR